MAYLEKNFQTDFGKWAIHKLQHTCAYELKAAKGNSLPFSSIKEHQISNLLYARHGLLHHKIPDLGNQNPFDGFILYKTPAYVGIMFNTESQRRVFYLIDIEALVTEIKTSKRKSITEDRAREIGARHVFA